MNVNEFKEKTILPTDGPLTYSPVRAALLALGLHRHWGNLLLEPAILLCFQSLSETKKRVGELSIYLWKQIVDGASIAMP